MKLTIRQIGTFLQAEIVGDDTLYIDDIAKIEEGTLSYRGIFAIKNRWSGIGGMPDLHTMDVSTADHWLRKLWGLWLERQDEYEEGRQQAHRLRWFRAVQPRAGTGVGKRPVL